MNRLEKANWGQPKITLVKCSNCTWLGQFHIHNLNKKSFRKLLPSIQRIFIRRDLPTYLLNVLIHGKWIDHKRRDVMMFYAFDVRTKTIDEYPCDQMSAQYLAICNILNWPKSTLNFPKQAQKFAQILIKPSNVAKYF